MSNKILEEIKQSLAVDKHEMLVDKLRNQNHDAYYKLDIQFDKAGNKRLMAKFAGLEII